MLWHRIHGLRIYSLPSHQRAILELDVHRCIVSPTNQCNVITQRIGGICAGSRNVYVVHKQHSQTFEASFLLFDGEHFCDAAIDVARSVFVGFGVASAEKFTLSHFTLSQQTFVHKNDHWMDYASFLRQVKGLPAFAKVEEAKFNQQCLFVGPG
jgi:hypothetical protein